MLSGPAISSTREGRVTVTPHRQRIAQLKDEVGELHPLLEHLFPRIPGITSVEYTHGNREMGADFILSRTHPNLGMEERVGVLAKIGKIHQDFSDVDRQIEECLVVPRNYGNGREKVLLDEIWVVATKVITQGAQDKINAKYKSGKVRFISGGKLAELIDNHFPQYWSAVGIEVNSYLASLRAENADADYRLSLIKAGDRRLYVEQEVLRVEERRYKRSKSPKRKRKPINLPEDIRRHRLVLLEGGMGAGKSKLLRHLVDRYTDPEVYSNEGTLPIPVSFKELVDDFSGDLGAVVEARVKREELREEVAAGEAYLFMIDSIDEKEMPPEELIEVLSNLSEQVMANVRYQVLLASRPLSGLEGEVPLPRTIHRYEIQPLSLSRVLEFLRNLCDSLKVQGRIIEDLKRSQLFRQLPRSPVAAIILAQLLNENSDDLPSNLTELYSKYIELVLGRWDVDKGLQSQREYGALDRVLTGLGRFVIENELKEISADEVKGWFTSYLGERNLDIDPESLYRRAVQRTELLVYDPRHRTVQFKHRTFAEFFCAKAWEESGELTASSRAFDLYWLNTYFFGVGLKRDAPQLLTDLLALETETEFQRWLKLLNMPDYFLAAYETPYHVVTKGIKELTVDAVRFYLKITQGDSTSPFVELPQMHVLYLFQFFLRHSYAYGFFLEGLETAALDLAADNSFEPGVLPYALFFLNVAYIDAGGEASFEFMLSQVDEAIPLDISFALSAESKQIRDRSSLMKKQDKRLRKVVRGSPAAKQMLDKLFDLPVALNTKALPTGEPGSQ